MKLSLDKISHMDLPSLKGKEPLWQQEIPPLIKKVQTAIRKASLSSSQKRGDLLRYPFTFIQAGNLELLQSLLKNSAFPPESYLPLFERACSLGALDILSHLCHHQPFEHLITLNIKVRKDLLDSLYVLLKAFVKRSEVAAYVFACDMGLKNDVQALLQEGSFYSDPIGCLIHSFTCAQLDIRETVWHHFNKHVPPVSRIFVQPYLG